MNYVILNKNKFKQMRAGGIQQNRNRRKVDLYLF